MRRGLWFQFGDRSQKMVFEQLQYGIGVGTIISPRDLARHKAIEYATKYRQLGADILIDQQFYSPAFSNHMISSYPIAKYRKNVSKLRQINTIDLDKLSNELELDNRELNTAGVIAPAIIYEADRPDIMSINARLFMASKIVGDHIGIPTYATVVIGRSATKSNRTINSILSHATALESDGWYYGFEFDPERIPSNQDDVLRCCMAGLKLACTGKPVLHSFAGPMVLLSFGFGATGAAIGHSQNLWKFDRQRWPTTKGGGGGGGAPPRFFSSSLWGTIIYPDETAQIIDTGLLSEILTASPFSGPVLSNLPWSRWDANKHLLYVICSVVDSICASDTDPRSNAKVARKLLHDSISLHKRIENNDVRLSDNTNAYQRSWMNALNSLLSENSDDYDFLDLLR